MGKRVAPFVLGALVVFGAIGYELNDQVVQPAVNVQRQGGYNQGFARGEVVGKNAGTQQGFAAGVASVGKTGPKSVEAAAKSFCDGVPTLDQYGATGIVQADLDTYRAAYAAGNRSCRESTYLGSVPYNDGTADYVYRIVINVDATGKTASNWYVFTVGTDGLISNFQ